MSHNQHSSKSHFIPASAKDIKHKETFFLPFIMCYISTVAQHVHLFELNAEVHISHLLIFSAIKVVGDRCFLGFLYPNHVMKKSEDDGHIVFRDSLYQMHLSLHSYSIQTAVVLRLNVKPSASAAAKQSSAHCSIPQ